MKLLIITQRVDKDDPILGFFHRWIEECAAHAEQVTVIGQQVGSHILPDTVTVLSLGKEEGISRARQIARFWRLLFVHRREYDAVFVHMTPVWTVLGYPFWALLGKRRYLWYEARGGGLLLRLATAFSRAVFGASDQGMPFRSRKRQSVGHGIDTHAFSYEEGEGRDPLVVTVGRITAAKRPLLLLSVFARLPDAYALRIVGEPRTDADRETADAVQRASDATPVSGRVTISPLPQHALPSLLRRATLFLHASETALDKALLEAMACGCLVISAAPVARDLLPEECVATEETMTEKARRLLSLPLDEQETLRRSLRATVVDGHSLPRLISCLLSAMEA